MAKAFGDTWPFHTIPTSSSSSLSIVGFSSYSLPPPTIFPVAPGKSTTVQIDFCPPSRPTILLSPKAKEDHCINSDSFLFLSLILSFSSARSCLSIYVERSYFTACRILLLVLSSCAPSIANLFCLSLSTTTTTSFRFPFSSIRSIHVLRPLRQILIILDPFQSFGNSFDAIRWHSYDSPFSYVSSRPRQFFRYCLYVLSVVCSSLCSA